MYGTHGQQNFYHPHQQVGGPGFGPGFAPAPPKPVGVFWDIENCPLPKSTAASSVVHFIRNSFVVNRLNHREYEFLIACDVSRLRKDIPEDINKSGGVTLAHVSGNSKNAADEKLRESMKRFVDTHASLTPMLILISGDIDFVNDLRGFQTRMGCTIVVLHGPTASQHFKIGWNEVYAFQDFLMRMPAAVAPKEAATPTNGKMTTGTKKNDEGGIPPLLGQRSAPMIPANSNFSGARPPNPASGAPPFVKPERNAAKFPIAPGDFNPAVPQQPEQYGIGVAADGGPLSNRAKKRALKLASEGSGPQTVTPPPNVGSAAAFPGSIGYQNQFQHMQNNAPAMAGGHNSNNAGAAQQNGPPGSDGIAQSKRAQKRANKKPGQNDGEVSSLPNAVAASPLQGAGKTNKQKPGPLALGSMPNAPQPGNQKKKGQGVPVPVPLMPGAAAGANGPKPPKQHTILMVSGLPGKMDFRILKEHLQNYASTVSGKVMYVHNGQGFISFKKKEDADKAIQLFQGREIYGKKLNIQLSKSIPFQNPKPEGAGSSASGGGAQGQVVGGDFVVVNNRPPLQASGPGGNNLPKPNSTLLAEGFAAFATAAFKELSLKQAGPHGDNAGQKGNKKEKAPEDPNCVIQ